MRLQYKGETGWTKGIGHLVKNGLYESTRFSPEIKKEWKQSGKLTEYKELKKHEEK